MKRALLVFVVVAVLDGGCRRSLDRSHLPALAASAAKLEKGMPKAQVDALLGEPYAYGELWLGSPERPQNSGKLTAYYDGSDKLVAVDFNQEEEVLAFVALDPPPLPPGQYQGFGMIKPKGK